MSLEPQSSIRDLVDGADLLRRLERLEALIPALASESVQLPNQVVTDAGDTSKTASVIHVGGCPGPEYRITESTQAHSPRSPEKDEDECVQEIVPPTLMPRARLCSDPDSFGPPVIDFPESVYSDFVVTCARGRPWQICTSLMVLAICLLVQSAFTSMVAIVAVDGVTEMTSHEGKDGDNINLYKKWVESLDTNTTMGTNLNKQGLICHGLSWSWESEMAGEMQNYAAYSALSAYSMPDGRFFGYVAITLWIGYCFQELRSIAAFVCLLFMPPPPDAGNAYEYDPNTGMGRLRGLTNGVRLAIIAVAAARLVLSLCLGFFGIRFLAYTTNLNDFILNCVALLFVQDIDDLCFAVLLSRDKQKAVRTIEPPLMEGLASRGLAVVMPATEIVSVLLIFIVVCSFSTIVEEFSDAFIVGAYDRVCEGYL